MFCPADFSPYPWMEYALAAYGIREIPGQRSNPRIDQFLASVGMGPGDETAWCSGFVNWCMEQAGITGTGRANARSWLTWTGGGMCLAKPTWGCVTVLWRESPTSWKGHVGFAVGKTPDKITLLGGNQGDAVSIQDYDLDRVLEYIWPRGFPMSTVL